MDLKLSVPFEVELTKEDGWTQLDRHLYFAARLHLHIERTQHELAYGDVLRSYHTTQFSETEVAKGFEEEITVVDAHETTRSMSLSEELRQALTATIGGAAKTPFFELSSNIGASLETAVRSSVEQSLRTSQAVTRRVRRTFTVTDRIKSGASEVQVAVAGYRRYRQDVFLHYIDYLFVEYRTTALGLRKKKRNLPRPVDGEHINRIRLNLPLFRLSYWNLESESSLLFSESDYRRLHKATHPDRVHAERLHRKLNLPLPDTPDRPTLYTLSNICFPLRWIDRQGPWTKEALEQIELEEAEGSAWWYQYGPGKRGVKGQGIRG